MAKRRLAILRHAEEVTSNVALTCCYYGISRHAFYKWCRRYEEFGLDGLRDRSSRPLGLRPNETRTEVVGKISHLRQTYHFGPSKISMYLNGGLLTTAIGRGAAAGRRPGRQAAVAAAVAGA